MAASGGVPASLALADLSPAAAAAAMSREGLTLTAAYSRYAEAADALRHERAERRKIQAYLDAILGEVRAGERAAERY